APAARAAVEDDLLLAIPVEDRLQAVLDGEDEAGRALRVRLDPDVEPHRAVEGELLFDQEVGQFVGEGLRVLLTGEVPVLAAPAGDGLHHAADQLPDTVFALRGAQRAAEVFRHHHVGGELGPGLGDFDLVLLEHHLALLAGDHGAPFLPLHFGERVHPAPGEVTPPLDPPLTPAGSGLAPPSSLLAAHPRFPPYFLRHNHHLLLSAVEVNNVPTVTPPDTGCSTFLFFFRFSPFRQ